MAGGGTDTAKRGDSPDGESFGYAATLRAANERGGEREVGREWGEGMPGGGTGADECARKTPAKRGLFLR